MGAQNRTRSAAIAATLRDEILRGQYRPGERLPSERDLAARHATSRGTVREALKKLEQLGLADIQPGGARAASLEDCSLEVLGPLLDVDPTPDSRLTDQILELGGLLMRFAAESAVRHGEPRKLVEIRGLLAEIQHGGGESEAGEPVASLLRSLAEASDHLVLRLIMNGLREQVREHLSHVCGPHVITRHALQQTARRLDSAVARTDPAEAGAAIEALFDLLRANAEQQRVGSHPPERVAS